MAAVLQGAPVTTFDIDALVKVDPENLDRLAKVLAALDARYREHGDLRPTRNDLAADSGPFDVLGVIGGGKRYDDVVGSARQMSVGDLSIKVLSLAALIEDKKAIGRDKDLAVVKLLEAVLARQRSS